jgi:hypothetical protein
MADTGRKRPGVARQELLVAIGAMLILLLSVLAHRWLASLPLPSGAPEPPVAASTGSNHL